VYRILFGNEDSRLNLSASRNRNTLQKLHI